MLRTAFNYFLFTSVYISLCALLMIWQTDQVLHLYYYDRHDFYCFVFFSTICSYNFHWYLTPGSYSSSERLMWGERHRLLMLVLCGIGLLGALYFFWPLRGHWLALSGAAILTFLYSAPKVPHKTFMWLRRIAIGKTLFLTFVWTYVTTLLPALIADQRINAPVVLFTLHRFALIYAICILFDYRDLESDKKEGIRSLITYLNEKDLNRLYYLSLLTAALSAVFLYPYTSWPVIGTLLFASAATALITRKAQQTRSDYMFYFVLDGFMMLSALLHLAWLLIS
ncbi:UbiA family prenyltransferase [Chitinophaga vietnamensis]|uniref:UbiA family prenyltransferase n=1 Tax=Chitinophaga vietnamensis TaxID=2593957 RepID=UPI001177BAF3|nr:UbiA family prenyltransferase [Chitinophaga vietnamensis]